MGNRQKNFTGAFTLQNLCGAFWLLAFGCAFMYPRPISTEMQTASILLLILSGLCVIGERRSAFQTVLTTPILLLYMLWAVLYASTLWSAAPFISLQFAGLFGFLPVTLMLFTGGGQSEQVRKISAGTVALFAGMALAIIWQFYLYELELDIYGDWFLENQNLTGSMMCLAAFALPSLIYRKVPLYFLMIILILPVFLGCNMGSIAAYSAAFVAFLILKSGNVQKRMAVVSGLAISGALGLLGLSIIFPDAMNTALGNRLGIWTGAFQLVLQNPFIGSGYGTYALFYPTVRIEGADTTFGVYAHMDALQLWIEAGIAAFALFIVLLLSLFLTICRAADRTRPRHLLLGCGILGFCLHSFVTPNFYSLPNLMFLGLMLCLWLHGLPQAPKRSNAGWVNTASAALVFIAWGALTLCLSVSDLAAKQAGQQISRAQQGETFDLESFYTATYVSEKLSLGLNEKPYQLNFSLPFTVLESEARLPAGERENLLRQSKTYLNRMEDVRPSNPAVPYYRARLLEIERPDHKTEINKQLTAALKADPSYLNARMAMARRLDESGQKEQARSVLRDGLMFRYLPPLEIELWARIAALENELGNMDAAAFARSKVEKKEKKRRLRREGGFRFTKQPD